MGDCISPAAISDIATKDTNRVIGSVAKALAANSPFIGLLKGGVLPSGVSDEVRAVVQMPAAPGDSLAIPTFVNDTAVCGTSGLQDKVNTVDFSYRLGTKRGTGPRVCVKQGYAAFKSSYLAAEDSLADLVTQYINADIRAQLLLQSASKFTVKAGTCFSSLFAGGEFTDIGVQFAGATLPDGPLTFQTLHYLSRHLKNALWADMFPSDGKVQPHFRFIGSPEQVEAFRNEVGVQNVLMSLTSGGYKLGETALSAFSFESSPAYRGIAFAEDQTPLRASGFDGDGDLVLVDPRLTVTDPVTNNAHSVANPAWLAAEYEISFLVADKTFERQVPERYIGEGSFKFAPQLHMGELQWVYRPDTDCNLFGDYGQHIYAISRAYRPLRPHHIIAILSKRCPADLGIETCTVTSCEEIGRL